MLRLSSSPVSVLQLVYTLCCILGQSKGPKSPFQKMRDCSSQFLKQTLADLFSSAGVFFFSVVFAALFIIFPFILSPAKPSKEGLQFIFCYTDPDPAWFFVAYGHWGYSPPSTSVSSFITLIFFFIPKSIRHFSLQASLLSKLRFYLYLFSLN